jgi:hypothetical protein
MFIGSFVYCPTGGAPMRWLHEVAPICGKNKSLPEPDKIDQIHTASVEELTR